MDAAGWIAHLQLAPHPEGGYYRRVYTAADSLAGATLPARYQGGTRPAATAIFYLLPGGECSHLHRLRSDELWHFHHGSPLTLHLIGGRGDYSTQRLGSDPAGGQSFLGVVPTGCWFGATVDDPDGYSLVGCTVAPGFDFADFEQGRQSELLRRYPPHTALIQRLTRPEPPG